MKNHLTTMEKKKFHQLEIVKKQKLTEDTFLLELSVPQDLRENYKYEAGQYLTFKFSDGENHFLKDYSMVSAPHEERLVFGIKINHTESTAEVLFNNYNEGDKIEVSEPKGRFVIATKPHEFRTILGFAMGIGITPLLSHFKNILHREPRTRLFLFYGNKNEKNTVFKSEIDELAQKFADRFQVYYFYSKEEKNLGLFNGRIDAQKLKLIINQILHLDDTDEESTIWDAVDNVLICGKGEMIKEIANACYENGIPKKSIHFELFAEFNEDIYPQEIEFPKVENIVVDFKINNKNHTTILPNNEMKILQHLIVQGFEVPYSCKSGICGSCVCSLQEGEVELLENEYLTEKEEASGKILACMSIPLSHHLKLDFDN